MHDKGGSKLDGRAKEGRWVGFDDESKAHQIYWAEKRSVTVERSVRFVQDEVGVPFEGEMEDFDKPDRPQANDDNPVSLEDDTNSQLEGSASHKTATTPGINETTDETPRQLVEPTVAADGDNGRGKRIRKESTYVRRIREGENITTLPRGLQTVSEKAVKDADVAEGAWEAEEEDWAMVTVMDAAECLNSTYEEAKRRSDWPKWQEAIQAELQSLEANKMWSVVERPKDTNVVSLKWVLRIKKNAAGEIEKYKA